MGDKCLIHGEDIFLYCMNQMVEAKLKNATIWMTKQALLSTKQVTTKQFSTKQRLLSGKLA